jgi:hypothetical protein
MVTVVASFACMEVGAPRARPHTTRERCGKRTETSRSPRRQGKPMQNDPGAARWVQRGYCNSRVTAAISAAAT